MGDCMTDAGLRVCVTNVRHGHAQHGRGHLVYADLLEADTGCVLVNATLDYVMAAVAERSYVLVESARPAAASVPEARSVRLKNVLHHRRADGTMLAFANVVDAASGQLLIGATLDKAMRLVTERAYVLVGDARGA